VTVFKKTFINYLSLGYDARVGFGVEKNRSSHRCCNKFMYFWEGLKKNCCRKTIRLNSLIESLHTVNISNESHIDITTRENQGRLETIFKTEKKSNLF
jgi:hypothetical protein